MKSTLTSAHSLPKNLEEAINSEELGDSKMVACCHRSRSGNRSLTEVGWREDIGAERQKRGMCGMRVV